MASLHAKVKEFLYKIQDTLLLLFIFLFIKVEHATISANFFQGTMMSNTGFHGFFSFLWQNILVWHWLNLILYATKKFKEQATIQLATDFLTACSLLCEIKNWIALCILKANNFFFILWCFVWLLLYFPVAVIFFFNYIDLARSNVLIRFFFQSHNKMRVNHHNFYLCQTKKTYLLTTTQHGAHENILRASDKMSLEH